jgi:hypothetical protein
MTYGYITLRDYTRNDRHQTHGYLHLNATCNYGGLPPDALTRVNILQHTDEGAVVEIPTPDPVARSKRHHIRTIPNLCPACTTLDALDTEWRDQAACLDSNPDWWFPLPGASTQYDQAKAICDRCPVKAECLNYALALDMRHGMWGGLIPQERPHQPISPAYQT